MALVHCELTDEQLAAEAAREGSDGPAFVELMSRFQQRVWNVCFRLMGSNEDASDAAQEVFVRLFLNRGKFEGRSKYSTWVHGIALRTCLTLRRGRARRERREATARAESLRKQQPDQTPPASDAELSLDLLQMLDTLDEEDRALLIMKYAEGHSYEELAVMFNLSVSACKMRISRARQRLQQRFPEHGFARREEE